MKKFSPSETRLAVAAGATIFLVLNLMLVPRLLTANREAAARVRDLQAQVAAAETWIGQTDFWAERRQWLQETEPSLEEQGRAAADQLEELQAHAADLGLILTDVELLSPPATEFYNPLGARFTAIGPWPAFVDFIAGLQDPELFDVFPRFILRSDSDALNIRAELEMQRWYQDSTQ